VKGGRRRLETPLKRSSLIASRTKGRSCRPSAIPMILPSPIEEIAALHRRKAKGSGRRAPLGEEPEAAGKNCLFERDQTGRKAKPRRDLAPTLKGDDRGDVEMSAKEWATKRVGEEGRARTGGDC